MLGVARPQTHRPTDPISELADRFVKDPADVVKVNQRVEVTVLDVETLFSEEFCK
ncbi:MAG: S1 RNA-binding domain-containing protein [Deltaproteobacteria bacterium]|nr:S1 RNA-binding domain-containing protein [Deltaproteobacteria bacterium]MBW1816626.1 S1 RNA-binding domain-containing protein [Deltaproteobacteria bacterium]MBW2284909.1 S1 RNA-binding domain-containing protein [Deltaproteobacteria bacterium]